MEPESPVNCPSCGHENRETARFCEACASPLARSCSSCGAELRANAKFCDQCATPAAPQGEASAPERDLRAYTPRHLADRILQSKSALEGERKQVIVLFADVKGSMERTAGSIRRCHLRRWARGRPVA